MKLLHALLAVIASVLTLACISAIDEPVEDIDEPGQSVECHKKNHACGTGGTSGTGGSGGIGGQCTEGISCNDNSPGYGWYLGFAHNDNFDGCVTCVWYGIQGGQQIREVCSQYQNAECEADGGSCSPGWPCSYWYCTGDCP